MQGSEKTTETLFNGLYVKELVYISSKIKKAGLPASEEIKNPLREGKRIGT